MKHSVLVLAFTVFISIAALAQKEYTNWYFGKNAAINFNTSPPTVLYNNAMSAKISAASMSDKNTGKLLFYTDGYQVWNAKHEIMDGGDWLVLAGVPTDVAIVPFPKNTDKYYIFSRPLLAGNRSAYSVVDISQNGGLGKVITRNGFLKSISGNIFFVTKHAIDAAYWFVSYGGDGNNDVFYAHKVTDDGVDTLAVKSVLPTYPLLQRTGEITTTSDGSKIAISYYDPNGAAVQLYDFDKVCGKASNTKKLTTLPNWKLAQGVSFSADDTKLYVTFATATGGIIVQYYGTNFSQWQIVAASKLTFNGLRLGADKQIYISINDEFQKPTAQVDILKYPDSLEAATRYTTNYLDLGDNRTTNYKFPTMIYDKSPFGAISNGVLTVDNVCIGDHTQFGLTTAIPYDSLIWDFGDGTLGSKLTAPTHSYADTGTYTPTATYFLCNQSWTVAKTIKIVSKPRINWNTDTVFCHQSSTALGTPFNTGKFTWSTGETSQSINISKEGLYWVTIVLGSCTVSDSINTHELPPILIELGENYTVCEHDTTNLVKLDAGKGYVNYMWTPTGDTTQWIIVKQAGDYYVVVEDYRGCKGDDGTQVARLCGYDFYMPNAFTPNGDGINDVFMPTALDILDFELDIYNSWGEHIFTSHNLQQGWDGTYKGKTCPQGVYIYKARFKGYSNKLLKVFNYKGGITLLR